MVDFEGHIDPRSDDTAGDQGTRNMRASIPTVTPRNREVVGFRSSSQLRILLIGINYAPELTGIAPYTTELAEHYAKMGHAVRVVTGLPHYPEWRRMSAPARQGTNPSVCRYWHHVPRRANALGRLLYEATWLISASRVILRGSYDAVVGVVPSLSGGLLAVSTGRRFGLPAGVVVKDLMGPAAAQSGYRGGKAVAGLTIRMERFVVRNADRVAFISDGFWPYLRSAGVSPHRAQRVRDWTHPGSPTESIEACRARLGWAPTDFICLHAGNMGQKQGLSLVLDAARRLPQQGIRVVLSGDGNDRERLIDHAKQIDARNVSFFGLQPPGQFESMLRAADVLLVSQRPSVADMSLPSKLASYFSAGRPVVAAVADNSETAREIRAARAGIVIEPGNPEALALALLRMRDSAERTAHMLGRNGARYAAHQLTPQAGLRAYDEFLDKLLQRRTDLLTVRP